MTNKEYFLKVMESEAPVFIKVIKALPFDKVDFRPNGVEKARPAGNLALQLAMQPVMISQIVNGGLLDFGKSWEPENVKPEQYADMAQKNFDQMKADIQSASDDSWDKGKAKMVWPGGEWETEKFDMAWGMLFDAIHHRGQLSSYLRAMGEKVPSIYGGSADERP